MFTSGEHSKVWMAAIEQIRILYKKYDYVGIYYPQINSEIALSS